jgi:hypothetical protein
MDANLFTTRSQYLDELSNTYCDYYLLDEVARRDGAFDPRHAETLDEGFILANKALYFSSSIALSQLFQVNLYKEILKARDGGAEMSMVYASLERALTLVLQYVADGERPPEEVEDEFS